MQTSLNITFLGTGTSQGVPVIGCHCEVCTSNDPRDQRLRSSLLVNAEGKNLVIDTGPDFRQQMLREKIHRLDAVLITHGHKDHIGGMDDLRAFNYLRKDAVDVYARPEVQVDIRREFFYAFHENKYPGVPEIRLHTIPSLLFYIDGLAVLPIELLHHRLPVVGFRIGNMAYLTDASSIPDPSIELLKNLDILIINALRIQPHISHFHLEGALAIIERLKPARAYLTHISHKMGLHAEIEKILPSGVSQAFDGLNLQCQYNLASG